MDERLPQYIFRRTRGLKSSGASGCWTKLLIRDGKSDVKEVIVKQNMSGNIMMIFMLRGNGIALGTLIFVLEHFIRILKVLLQLLFFTTYFLDFIKSKARISGNNSYAN